MTRLTRRKANDFIFGRSVLSSCLVFQSSCYYSGFHSSQRFVLRSILHFAKTVVSFSDWYLDPESVALNPPLVVSPVELLGVPLVQSFESEYSPPVAPARAAEKWHDDLPLELEHPTSRDRQLRFPIAIWKYRFVVLPFQLVLWAIKSYNPPRMLSVRLVDERFLLRSAGLDLPAHSEATPHILLQSWWPFWEISRVTHTWPWGSSRPWKQVLDDRMLDRNAVGASRVVSRVDCWGIRGGRRDGQNDPRKHNPIFEALPIPDYMDAGYPENAGRNVGWNIDRIPRTHK